MQDRVFAYVTLKRGGANHGLLAPFVRETSTGSVPGVLLDLGGYPGWSDGAGTVWGDVLRVEPIAEALRVLDELEEYFGPGDPRNVYDRVTAVVRTPAGTVTAWAYRYLGPRAGAPVIPGGVWLYRPLS